MRIMISLAIGLISIMILVLGHSMASDYAFGTKVAPQDNDLGRLLKNIPDGTIMSFWDIGPNLGVYDGADVVYLDMPPTGIANANDIRLTPFSDHQPGSKIKPIDSDMNAPLKTLPSEIRFLNMNGSQSYDLPDNVYIHQSSAAFTPDISKMIKDPNEPTANPLISVPGTGAPTTAANLAGINPPNMTNDTISRADAYFPTTDAGNNLPYNDKDNLNQNDGFWEQLSYTGYCNNLPRGVTCLIFSDNFIWPVSDYPIDNNHYFVGYDNNGWPIESIRCNNAEYYHIIGTLFVKFIPRQKTLFIQSSSGQDDSIAGSSAENLERAADKYIDRLDTNKVLDAMNRIVANTDSINANDIRLTPIGLLAAGTKVQNFDPDLNKLVALPILVSFPRKSDDYACIRVYDANGNGLYDFLDDVYLDISFPGHSSFGAVSINDIRLSSPAVLDTI